jgi:hypothetical protein
MIFRFSFYDLDGHSSYLWWEVDDPVLVERLRALNPARRMSKGKIAFCISLNENFKLKIPKSIRQVKRACNTSCILLYLHTSILTYGGPLWEL